MLESRYEAHWYPRGFDRQRVAEEIQGKPDHPERWNFRVYSHRQAGVPTVFRRRVWLLSPTEWRLSEDLIAEEYPEGTFMDAAAARRRAFFLDRSTLSLLNPAEPAPPGKDLEGVRGRARRVAAMHLFGGMSIATAHGAELVDVRVEGSTWRARTRLPGVGAGEVRQWAMSGRWDAGGGRGFLERMDLSGVRDAELMRIIEPTDWRFDPALGRWVAMRVDERESDGRLFGRWVLIGAEPQTPQQVAAVLRVPADGTDAVRGSLRLSLVHDHTRGVSTMNTSQGPMKVELPPESQAPEARVTRPLRMLCWITAGCITIGLIALRVRRARVGRLPPTGGCARGFTLIESLMVIAVVAILAALLTPKYHEVRRSAWRATSLSNLRLHAAVFGVYANDFEDAFPYYVDPAAPVSEVGSRIRGVGYPTGYFGAAALWNYALADSYYEGDPFQICFYPPDYPYGVWSPEWRYGPTPYVYSCTFLADPAFWNPATRTGPSQWRPTRAHEVRFTDAKVLLISEFTTPRDRDSDRPIPPPTNDRWEVATTVGAAMAVPAGRMNRGYRRGDGHWSVPGHVSAGTPGTHTIDGIHGRDWP